MFPNLFQNFYLSHNLSAQKQKKNSQKREKKMGGKKSENANKFSRKKIYKNQEDAFLTELGHVTADALR